MLILKTLNSWRQCKKCRQFWQTLGLAIVRMSTFAEVKLAFVQAWDEPQPRCKCGGMCPCFIEGLMDKDKHDC